MTDSKLNMDNLTFSKNSNTNTLEMQTDGTLQFSNTLTAVQGMNIAGGINVQHNGEILASDVMYDNIILKNGSGQTTLYSNSSANSINITFPEDGGTNKFSLITDGSGNLSYSNLMPVGAVQTFALTAAPTGWIACNGAAISRSTYYNLYSAIGTTFGSGNGTTTFTIPDLRDRFVRSSGDSRPVGVTAPHTTALPSTSSYSISINSAGGHNHTAGDEHRSGTQQCDGPDWLQGEVTANTGYSFDNRTTSTAGAHTHTGSLGGGDTETAPVHIVLLYCIKY